MQWPIHLSLFSQRIYAMPINQIARESSVVSHLVYSSSGPNDMPGVANINAARDAESNRSALNANQPTSDSPTTDSTVLPRTDESREQYSLRLQENPFFLTCIC